MKALIAFVLIFLSTPENSFANPTGKPQRIISMSPAITEFLFEIGVGNRIVGITDFCIYPPAIAGIPRVGGFLNPNLERLVSLKPDLIILNNDSAKLQDHARNLGIKTLKLSMLDLDNILKSVLILGNELGAEESAQALHDNLKHGIEYYQAKVKEKKKKSALIILADSSEMLKDLFAAGKGTFLDELLTLAGGENILTSALSNYPKLTKEFIVSRSPEIIIEAIPRPDFSLKEGNSHKSHWGNYTTIQAVKDNNIHFVIYDFILIPGPRLLQIVDAFAKAIHPELFLKSNKELERRQ